MALQILNNCCTDSFIQLHVCDCFDGFQIAGLTPDTIYSVKVQTSKKLYLKQFIADESGALQIPAIIFPDRVFNQYGGVYELIIEGVTFDSENYTGFQFSVIDCEQTGFFIIANTPNE